MSSYYRQEFDGRNYLAMIGLTYRWQNMENVAPLLPPYSVAEICGKSGISLFEICGESGIWLFEICGKSGNALFLHLK